MFVRGRSRYHLVAGLALLVAVLLGLVPFEEAFAGFSNDIVIIIGSALLVSAAVASFRHDRSVPPTARIACHPTRAQLILLVTIVTLLTGFVKNIGALAMMLPIAFQMAKYSKSPPSVFLMPMAFGSLLGGLTTLIGDVAPHHRFTPTRRDRGTAVLDVRLRAGRY